MLDIILTVGLVALFAREKRLIRDALCPLYTTIGQFRQPNSHDEEHARYNALFDKLAIEKMTLECTN